MKLASSLCGFRVTWGLEQKLVHFRSIAEGVGQGLELRAMGLRRRRGNPKGYPKP